MKTDRLMRNFVRETGQVVEVRVITRISSFTSESEWIPFEILSPDPTHAELREVKQRALADPRYFTRCEECGGWTPAGLMHDNTTCEACAERTLGVLH